MENLERISHLLATDPAFCRACLDNAAQSAADRGIKLNDEQTRSLRHLAGVLALPATTLTVYLASVNYPLWSGAPLAS